MADEPISGDEIAEGPQEFTRAEQEDLARFLAEPLPEQVFVIPGAPAEGAGQSWFKGRMWEAATAERFKGAGVQYFMAVERDRQSGKITPPPFKTDSVAQYRFLVDHAVTDFCFTIRGKEYLYSKNQEANWSVFRSLHPKVSDWVQERLRDFLGLTDQGNASGASSKPILEAGGDD